MTRASFIAHIRQTLAMLHAELAEAQIEPTVVEIVRTPMPPEVDFWPERHRPVRTHSVNPGRNKKGVWK